MSYYIVYPILHSLCHISYIIYPSVGPIVGPIVLIAYMSYLVTPIFVSYTLYIYTYLYISYISYPLLYINCYKSYIIHPILYTVYHIYYLKSCYRTYCWTDRSDAIHISYIMCYISHIMLWAPILLLNLVLDLLI